MTMTNAERQKSWRQRHYGDPRGNKAMRDQIAELKARVAQIEDVNNERNEFMASEQVKTNGAGANAGSGASGTIGRITVHDGQRLVVDTHLAMIIASRHAFVNQRKLYDKNYLAFVDELRNGRFRPGSQMVFARLPDGRLILCDAYHRLMAIRESGRSLEFQVRIEQCENMEEVRTLYCSIDTNLRKRTDAEVISAVGLSERLSINGVTMKFALGAVAVIANDLQAVKSVIPPNEVLTAAGRMNELNKWTDEIRAYDEILKKAPASGARRKMLTQGVMSVALVTLRHQREKATAFWSGIAENDGLRTGDPRRALLLVLMNGAYSGRPNTLLVYTSRAWNAWFEGRQLGIIRITDNMTCAPLGTPFAGKTKEGAAAKKGAPGKRRWKPSPSHFYEPQKPEQPASPGASL